MSRYLKGIREDLPLTDEEFRDLVDDPAPYLRRGSAHVTKIGRR